MCSVITHPIVPIVLLACLPAGAVSHQLLAAGAVCSVIPDMDVLGFSAGIRYGDMLGHRGITHSIVFAATLGALVTFALFRDDNSGYGLTFMFLFLSTLSHPLLDMLTNGGLGVALLAPLSSQRFFFPWRPIEVSPIGFNFLSERGMRVLLTEFRWVWLPSAAVVFTAVVIRRYG